MMFERCVVQCSAVIVGGGKGERKGERSLRQEMQMEMEMEMTVSTGYGREIG